MEDVKDGHRTPGERLGGTGARESRTQLGKPVQDNNENSDTGPTNWEERYKAQRELTRKIEAQKNEALKQRDELLTKHDKPADNEENNKDSLSSAVVDELRKLHARLDAKEKEEYVDNAVKAHGGISEEFAEELKDLPITKVTALLAHIPVPKKPVTKPDSASVTGAADTPASEKRTYTQDDLKTMPRAERMKVYEAGLLVDSEGNSIT